MVLTSAPGTTSSLPLASLWGLPQTSEDQALAEASLPKVQQDTLHLGGTTRLATSAGVTVSLPSEREARERLLPRLEAWAAQLMSESYRPGHAGSASLALRAYYAARPLMPRKLQLWLRRLHARGRAEAAVLGWPIDPLFVALAESYLAIRLEAMDGRTGVLRRAPPGYRATAVLTHDVEGTLGQDRCRDLADLEEAAGYRSCFNFVAERYPLDQSLMDELRQRGFEIGLHGIKHDGLKFSRRDIFEDRLAAMKQYRDAWGVTGFRSPATHRRWEWMSELPFEYDSSFPDTDPFEPVPGGCGSPWPFFIGPLLELPITLPQDHTVWEILEQPALPLWTKKTDWLRQCGGLINIIVHPDYLGSDLRWNEYRQFCAYLKQCGDVWVALPRDVAGWWRRRERQAVKVVQKGAAWELLFG